MKYGEWISVNSCMPLKGSHVLGVLGCGTRLVLFYDDPNYGEGWVDWEGNEENPRYWTPLPDVPKELR
jgi:hypothetical protein